jgi:hypothetical protein
MIIDFAIEDHDIPTASRSHRLPALSRKVHHCKATVSQRNPIFSITETPSVIGTAVNDCLRHSFNNAGSIIMIHGHPGIEITRYSTHIIIFRGWNASDSSLTARRVECGRG